MPTFNLHILDGKQARVAITADSSHQAIETGVEALAHFLFRNFPPPENLAIAISDEQHNEVAKVSFTFKIDYGPGVVA